MDPYRAVNRSSSATFWHGGHPGLGAGSQILPQSELKRQKIALTSRPIDYDHDLVHITDDRQLARAYAALLPYAAGDVYEVVPSPTSSIRIDDDFPSAGLTCTRALITRVVATAVTMPTEEAVQTTARHMKWEDGSATYSPEGHMNVAPEWPGADADQLAGLGTWLPWEVVKYNKRTRMCVVDEALLSRYRQTTEGVPRRP